MATTATSLSEQEYREIALRDDHLWELWDGVLVEKPPMSATHDNVSFLLGHFLQTQLDLHAYRVNVNGGKTRYTAQLLDPGCRRHPRRPPGAVAG